ncbi:MAG TPA: aldolase/citrate lyase family protein [Aurantimonas sp.]|jgi:4-hydroxy-2-oxoheptanedioate aldolase|nr:aldolase/citrate lyase family protein [Aurantimonas sp.]
MALFDLREALGQGRCVLSSWLGLSDPIVQEAFLRAGFDAVTFDMQHGLQDVASLRDGIALAVHLGRPALVRLPVEDHALASRSLDFGASAVIMPMIDSVEDARALVSVAKYPPLGQRSYGPTRAADLHRYLDRADYVGGAASQTLAFAMIETARALAALDEILAIDGLDGVFVGPSDLSIALSGDGTLNPRSEANEAAIQRIVAAADAHGKIAGIYAGTPDDVKRYRALGYRLVCVGSDFGVITAGARALADASRV